MSYDKFQREMEKNAHGDGISVGAGWTGEFTLYGFFIITAFLLGRIFGKVPLVLFGLMVMEILISFSPTIFAFEKENSNAINYQLFWLSVFCGILALVIYFA
ncbi:hypothetical protein [Methanotorris formicicus]|uniref:Uncharacterized protein n=1 Tax=Methanotorris formicicus Mc-S-70 TaxID=647171 RepID=H1KXT3_9EURY|nr:hypothetical protein [Methanotorris formicicus]EHP87925.1 hypothetical protein MetfoDRAFT_0606 [Methanotorris formicicus Mc-S-70]